MPSRERPTAEDRADPLTSVIRSQRILLRHLLRTVRSKDGLTLQQMAVLRILAGRGPTSMHMLGEELMVTRPNVTGIIDRMEEKGLVERVPSSVDRRMKDIVMTEKGTTVQDAVVREYRESLARLMDVLTDEEKETLAILLQKLAKPAQG